MTTPIPTPLVNQTHLRNDVRNGFRRLAIFRRSAGMPVASLPGDNSTLALLQIGNQEIYGNNTKTAGIPMSIVTFIKELLKDVYTTSAHTEVLKHAEADALIQAFNTSVKATSATMYVDRKPCGFCSGKNFSGGSLKRLFPLVGLQNLTMWAPDESGKIACINFYASGSGIKNTVKRF
jgi:hypothetical protein